MADIAPYTGDPLARAVQWSSLELEERKRRAAAACRDRDAEALTEIMLADMRLYGNDGNGRRTGYVSRVSPRTVVAYRSGIRALLASWAGVNLLRPTADDVAVMVRRWEAAGLSSSTVTVRLAAARALYRALRRCGALDADPFADARAIKDETPAHEKRRPYEQETLDRILGAARGHDRLLILLGAHAGLRAMEIVALEWRDVDTAAGRLYVRNGKRSKPRTVPLSGTLSRELAAAAPADLAGFVLPYRSTERARQRLRAVCDRAGVQLPAGMRLHSLRHYFGTRLYGQTGRLEDAQHVLGHANIATTQIYAHWADQRARDALKDW